MKRFHQPTNVYPKEDEEGDGVPMINADNGVNDEDSVDNNINMTQRNANTVNYLHRLTNMLATHRHDAKQNKPSSSSSSPSSSETATLLHHNQPPDRRSSVRSNHQNGKTIAPKSTNSSSSSVASSYTTSSNEYTLTNEESDDDDDDDNNNNNNNNNIDDDTSQSHKTSNIDATSNKEQTTPSPSTNCSHKSHPSENKDTSFRIIEDENASEYDKSATSSLRTSDYATDYDEGTQLPPRQRTPRAKHPNSRDNTEDAIFIANPAYLNFKPLSKDIDSDEDNNRKDASNCLSTLDDLILTEQDSSNDKKNNNSNNNNNNSPSDSGNLSMHEDINSSSTPLHDIKHSFKIDGSIPHFQQNTTPMQLHHQATHYDESRMYPLATKHVIASSTPTFPSPSPSSFRRINKISRFNTPLQPLYIDTNSLKKSTSQIVPENGSPLPGILRKSFLTNQPSPSPSSSYVFFQNGTKMALGLQTNGDVSKELTLDMEKVGFDLDNPEAGRTNQKGEYSPEDTPTVVFSCGRRDSDNTIGTLDTTMGVSLLDNEKPNNTEDKITNTVTGKEKASVLRESLFLILSSLYGILVVLIGAVIPITDVFVSEHVHSNFEAFYVYLYTVSLLFLIYVYAYLLRRNRFRNDFMNRSASFVRQLSRVWTRSESVETGRSDTKPRTSRRNISLDMTNHHTGTFYLRLGVLGFGMGSMIHCGLQFGSHFSLTEECSKKLRMIKPLLHMIFAFFQLYFIFMNSKMCIHRYKKLARFGLMHMCATNICVWFRSIVVETVHVIHSHKHRGSSAHSRDHYNIDDLGKSDHGDDNAHDGTDPDHNGTTTNNCYWSDIMHKAADSAGPYLYPCTIEYSLMCACILYIMWKNVGQRPIRRETSVDVGDDSDGDDKKRVHRMSVDCTSSSRGLFLGILTIVGSIISIIAFYMLVKEPDLKHTAFVLTHVSETSVYILTLVALFMASCKMKTFNFKVQQEAELEDILIVISYTGLVAFIVFSLMASIIHQASTSSILNIVSNITMLIQATLQTIFMLAGDRLCAATHEQVKRKPGREFVTFMLISNFAMWAINTFETQTPEHNPIQVDVYGIEAWAIFTHISVPLGIYYRFHSTVCMSNIWKNAWKLKKSSVQF